MKVMVTGGRDFCDRQIVWSTLDDALKEAGLQNFWLIHGDATGADSSADQWARQRGILTIKLPVYPRTWDRVGKRAGPLRNVQMVRMKPDLLIAFPGGNGTANAVREAEKAGIAIWRV